MEQARGSGMFKCAACGAWQRGMGRNALPVHHVPQLAGSYHQHAYEWTHRTLARTWCMGQHGRPPGLLMLYEGWSSRALLPGVCSRRLTVRVICTPAPSLRCMPFTVLMTGLRVVKLMVCCCFSTGLVDRLLTAGVQRTNHKHRALLDNKYVLWLACRDNIYTAELVRCIGLDTAEGGAAGVVTASSYGEGSFDGRGTPQVTPATGAADHCVQKHARTVDYVTTSGDTWWTTQSCRSVSGCCTLRTSRWSGDMAPAGHQYTPDHCGMQPQLAAN